MSAAKQRHQTDYTLVKRTSMGTVQAIPLGKDEQVAVIKPITFSDKINSELIILIPDLQRTNMDEINYDFWNRSEKWMQSVARKAVNMNPNATQIITGGVTMNVFNE